MSRIGKVHTLIVQGRWDIVCPHKSPLDLSRKFDPGMCTISIIDNVGHATIVV